MTHKSFLVALLILALTHSISAQKPTYYLPKEINNNNFSIRFDKVSSSTSSYFINYKAQNTGNGILLIDRKMTSLGIDESELYPTSDKYTLKPGDSKTVYNQFRIKAPVKPNSDLLKLSINGLSYAQANSTVKAEKFVLKEGAIQSFDVYQIKVMEYNVHPDRIYVSVKCTFNGKATELGKIDLPQIKVNGGKAEIVKKGDVLFSGKSYSFSINITPSGEETSIEFNDALQVLGISKIKIDPIHIKSSNYVEPIAEKVDSVKIQPDVPKDTTITKLSFKALEALKKDLETELNAGGKPIEMANEFLMENGPINVAQIIEIIAGFNLDGTRLKFAKMAYPFTSDKHKYHLVVGKLAYTKNKQGLEEFLEHQ